MTDDPRRTDAEGQEAASAIPARRDSPLSPDVRRTDAPWAGSATPPNGGRGGAGEPFEADEIDLLDLFRVIRRRWLWVVGVFILVMVGVGTYVETRIPVFESSTSLRFERANQPLSILPEAVSAGPTTQQLSTDMAIIRSLSSALDVAEALRLDVRIVDPVRARRSDLLAEISVAPSVLPGRYAFTPLPDRTLQVTSPAATTHRVVVDTWTEVEGFGFRPLAGALAAPFMVEVSSVDAAARALAASIQVTQPERGANILAVSYRSPNPELAQQVVTAVAQRFMDRQGEWRQAGGLSTINFIAEQLQLLEVQLADAEARVVDWRRQNRVVQSEQETGAEISRRSQYEAELARLREEISTLEALRAGTMSMTAEVRALPGYRRVLSSPIFATNQAGSTILSTILQLESERMQLLGSRSAQNPDVLLVERTLADYERQGEQFVENYIGTRVAQAASLERLLTTIGSSLLAAPGRELELRTLERDVEVLSGLQVLLSQRLKESEIASAAEIATVQILDPARIPNVPVAPNRSRILLVGALLALMAGVGIAFVRDRADQTLHSVGALEQASGAPLLGLIPSFSTRPGGGRYRVKSGRKKRSSALARGKGAPSAILTVTEPRHVSSEAYRVLRANLRAGSLAGSTQVVVVASPSPGDGKSTTALNLASALALQGERVLLIDADLRRGLLHQRVNLPRGPGLSEVLSTTGEDLQTLLNRSIQEVSLTPEVRLHLLPAGKSPENPTELLGGARWSSALLPLVRAHFDVIIVDTPPVNMFADSLVAAVAGDGVLLVARAGKTMVDEAEVAAGQIRSMGLRLLGGVLNDFNVHRDGRYGNYAYYQRYYGRYYAYYSNA
jgi:capsular exopolysaccharide synthesis family protein